MTPSPSSAHIEKCLAEFAFLKVVHSTSGIEPYERLRQVLKDAIKFGAESVMVEEMESFKKDADAFHPMTKMGWNAAVAVMRKKGEDLGASSNG